MSPDAWFMRRLLDVPTGSWAVCVRVDVARPGRVLSACGWEPSEGKWRDADRAYVEHALMLIQSLAGRRM